jgi:NADH dehydrogenase FAD-containing subunit
MIRNTKILVIGGGYAGVLAANRLTQRDDVSVTLVNPRSTFVERIRLHQLVGGSSDAVVDYRDVLADRVRLVVDSATRIDAARRSVTLAKGETLGYDYLIYAVGSGSAAPDVPGAAEFAHPIASLEEAKRLRMILGNMSESAAITVVGAGPTGIETAAELAETGRHVTLVSGDVLGPYLHARGRRAVAKRLSKLGVTVIDGPGSKVAAVTSGAVQLSDGRDIPSTVTIWTAGFAVPALAAESGLTTDAVGRLLTDETLTSVDNPRIIAAGDSAAPSGMPFRMSCQAAGQLGMHAADTVLNRIAGEQPEPVAIGFLGQCISLGRGSGLFQFSRKDDTAIWFHLGGRAAAKLKELVCVSTVKQLTDEARKPGSNSVPGWLTDSHRPQVLRELHAEQAEVLAA